MSASKDKRTKEQIIKLLDHAMEQEERLGDKIKKLEAELAECRKKVEDPRHELTEEALPASKVSFRIDYYRTAAKSPLKGIIEHLPSRQSKSFEGEGADMISPFVSRFLHEETGKGHKKKALMVEKPGNTPEVVAEVATVPEAVFDLTDYENATSTAESVRLSAEEYDALFQPALVPKPGVTVQTETPAGEPGSRLLRRLKAGLDTEQEKNDTGTGMPGKRITPPEPPARSAHVERLLNRLNEPEPAEQPAVRKPTAPPPADRPKLLQRLQEEYLRSLNQQAAG
jgi:hypothetical protein